MNRLLIFVAGATMTLSALLCSRAKAQPCLYFVETPGSVEAYYGLEDAQDALRVVGVDWKDTPVGYDIVSRPGC